MFIQLYIKMYITFALSLCVMSHVIECVAVRCSAAVYGRVLQLCNMSYVIQCVATHCHTLQHVSKHTRLAYMK